MINAEVSDTNIGDTISRQVAIDAFDSTKFHTEYCTEYGKGYNDGIDFAVSKLSALPSAQPKAVPVVRCKNCRYFDMINKKPIFAICKKHEKIFYLWQEDTREHFCSWAERRKDG